MGINNRTAAPTAVLALGLFFVPLITIAIDTLVLAVIGDLGSMSAAMAEPGTLAKRQSDVLDRYNHAVKNFEQSRFARTIRANQANPLTLGNRERNVLEERFGAVSLGKSLCSDNRRQMTQLSPASSVT